MSALRTTVASLAGLALLPAGAIASATVTPPAGTTTFPHTRLEAIAGDDAGELVLLTADQDGSGRTHRFDVTVRSSTGAWTAPVEIAADPGGQLGEAELALASDGTGLVAWNQYTGKHANRDTVWTRVRRTDGSWGPATLIDTRTDAFGFDHAEAVPGHLGLIYVGSHYQLKAATSTDGTAWHTTDVPGNEGGDNGDTVVMDGTGGLHSVVESIPRGGGGTIWLNRLAPDAQRWTKAQRIRTPYLSTDQAQLAVDAAGRELLLYGYVAHNGYRPPGDSEIVGSTAYALLGQRHPGGRFRTVWRAGAAGAATLSQGDGATRVSWEQWKGHTGHRPTKVLLRSAVLGTGHAVTVASATRGHFYFAAGGGATGAVSWLAPHAGQLWAAGVGGSAGSPVLLDDKADEAHWGEWSAPGGLAVAGAQPFVAWQSRFVQSSFEEELVDSDVSVAPLP